MLFQFTIGYIRLSSIQLSEYIAKRIIVLSYKVEIKLLLCDNLVILALGITHFTWIKGQHIVVNLLLIKPFWRTKSSFILELPTRVMTFLFL